MNSKVDCKAGNGLSPKRMKLPNFPPGFYFQICDIPNEKLDDFCTEYKAMEKQFYKDAFVWGFVLWLIGYLLGMILSSSCRLI
jgi:hypothetical protein